MFTAAEFITRAQPIGDLYTGVPCSVLKPFINYVIDSADVAYAPMNNEGEAIAFAAGAYVGGRRPVVMFQNSGLGNTVNPVTSLLWPFRIPLLLICTWRGQPGVIDEPQHELMGKITAEMLELVRVKTELLEASPNAMHEALDRAAAHMSEHRLSYGLVMPKGVVAPYALKTPAPTADLPCGVVAETEGGSPETSRYDLIQSTCDIVGEDHVIVGTTGKTGRELFTCRDSANHLYMVGSMGCAASFGLGLALQLPADRKVIVIDGDGAALMRLEALVTIGHIRPGNLIHLILDNHAYDSTGGQRTLSASVRLDRIAQACGYPYAVSVTGRARFEQELHQAMAEDGPHLIHARITPGSLGDLARPDIKPHEVKARLMDYLGTTRNDV